MRWTPEPKRLDLLLDAAAALPRGEGVALMVRALAGHLARPVDRGHALALASALDGPRAELAHAATPAARLVETLRRLHEQLRLNASDPRRWSEAERARVFDPDWLVRRCAGEPLLAAAAHRAWREAAARLAGAGEDVGALAWAALTGTRPASRLSVAG